MNHVSTQLPYAMTVAGVCVAGYILAGLVQNVFIVLGCSLAVMIGLLMLIRIRQKRKRANIAEKSSGADEG